MKRGMFLSERVSGDETKRKATTKKGEDVLLVEMEVELEIGDGVDGCRQQSSIETEPGGMKVREEYGAGDGVSILENEFGW